MQNEHENEYINQMLKDEISKLQSKIIEVDQKIFKMEGCCAQRHKTSLESQLQKMKVSLSVAQQKNKKLQDKLETVEKMQMMQNLETERRFNGIQDAMKERCKSVQEDNNQFRTRITILEQQKSKREEQKITIKTQVIIGIIVALITSLITTAVAYFSNFQLNQDNKPKHPQNIQTIKVNEQSTSK